MKTNARRDGPRSGARAERRRQVTSLHMVPTGDDNSDTGRVPIFGTWRAIYASVIVANVLVMVLIYLFSRFPY